MPDEVKQLKTQGHIPEHISDSQNNPTGDIEFAEQINDDLGNLSESDSESDY